MRNLCIVYSLFTIWMFGFLAGFIGIAPAGVITLLLALPGLVGWRTVIRGQEVKRREYVYFVIIALAGIGAMASIFSAYFGLHYLMDCDRKCQGFRRYVLTEPEFRDVEVAYNSWTGGWIELNGSVADEKTHDLLMTAYESIFKSDREYCHDEVAYPGKVDEDAMPN